MLVIIDQPIYSVRYTGVVYSEWYNKYAYIVYVIFFCSWYLLFMACVLDFEGPVVLGDFQLTYDLLLYLTIKYLGPYPEFSWFKNEVVESFCFQTTSFFSLYRGKVANCLKYTRYM